MLLSPKSLQVVADAVRDAGQAALAIQRAGDFSTAIKEDTSPVTVADLESNSVLVSALSAIDERYDVISEEQAQTGDVKGPLWLVDPLDGTKEFIKGLPDFTVNVALVENGIPKVGFVGAPAYDYLLWTDGHRLYEETELPFNPNVAQIEKLATELQVAVSASHMDTKTSAFIARIGRVGLRSMGSSLKIVALAVGAVHLYPRFGPTMLWDTAAADACLRVSGGALFGPDGDPLRYEAENLRNPSFLGIASEIAPKEKYIALMQEVLEQDFSE